MTRASRSCLPRAPAGRGAPVANPHHILTAQLLAVGIELTPGETRDSDGGGLAA